MSKCLQGISLSIDQYNALLAAAPLLETVLHKKDVPVTRPNYEANHKVAEAAEDEKEEQQPVTTDDNREDEE